MSSQNKLRIGSVSFSRKHGLLFVVMMLIALFPFPLSAMGASPGSFFLALPSWYWIAAVLVVVIYALIGVVLYDLNRAGPPGGE